MTSESREHERTMENVIRHPLGYFECQPFEACICGWNENGDEDITFEQHLGASESRGREGKR